MFFRVFETLFGCNHNRYSFPITLRKRNGSRLSANKTTYVVCLDCGKEMPYDWQEMKIGNPKAKPIPVPPLATKEAA